MKKCRADELLCLRGHCAEKEEAAILIMAGKVRTSADNVVRKPSEMLGLESPLLVDSGCPYVSRGAMKLKDALEKNAPDLSGMICGDIGASTGGFTDLMLSKNAAKVYAVDVGKGLLHWKLRTDKRVEVREGVNAKLLSKEIIQDELDMLVMDVSFISCTRILPSADPLLKKDAKIFILVKPQFEAGRENIGKGGIVKDKDGKIKEAVFEKIKKEALKNGFSLIKTAPSPIVGGDGNTEYLALFERSV